MLLSLMLLAHWVLTWRLIASTNEFEPGSELLITVMCGVLLGQGVLASLWLVCLRDSPWWRGLCVLLLTRLGVVSPDTRRNDHDFRILANIRSALVGLADHAAGTGLRRRAQYGMVDLSLGDSFAGRRWLLPQAIQPAAQPGDDGDGLCLSGCRAQFHAARRSERWDGVRDAYIGATQIFAWHRHVRRELLRHAAHDRRHV